MRLLYRHNKLKLVEVALFFNSLSEAVAGRHGKVKPV